MNIMKFAHFTAKRDRATYPTLYKSYREALSFKLYKAHQMVRRGECLEAAVTELKKIDRRIAGEKAVVRAAVRNAIKLGHAVSLYDGEEWCVKGSTSEKEVMENIYATDMETLSFRNSTGVVGKVYLVYGNSASEVISDHTDSEAVDIILAPANRRADKYAALGL
jgi:hypothetical protein